MDKPVPRRFSDRYLGMLTRHTFELIIAHGCAVLGVILLVAWADDQWNPAPAVALMPNYVHAVIGGPLLIGGLLDLAGMLSGARNHRDRWRLERAGLTLIAYSLVAYAAIALLQDQKAILPAVIAGTVALACTARLVNTFVEEHRTDAAKRQAREEDA